MFGKGGSKKGSYSYSECLGRMRTTKKLITEKREK